MTKKIYIAHIIDINPGGLWDDDKVTFDRNEAVKAAEYRAARLTRNEAKHHHVYVGVYDVDIAEDDTRTAPQIYHDMVLTDTFPIDHDVLEVG